MHHSFSRFCIAPRPLIIRRNTPFYVWYITFLCWNMRWQTGHVNILPVDVWISVETILVLIDNVSVVEPDPTLPPCIVYVMSLYWDIRGSTPFYVQHVSCQCCDITYQKHLLLLGVRYQRKHPSRH